MMYPFKLTKASGQEIDTESEKEPIENEYS